MSAPVTHTPGGVFKVERTEDCPGATYTRAEALALIWRTKHRDFKDTDADGTKRVLVLRSGGTHSVPLDALTDAEIVDLLPLSHRIDAKRRREGVRS